MSVRLAIWLIMRFSREKRKKVDYMRSYGASESRILKAITGRYR